MTSGTQNVPTTHRQEPTTQIKHFFTFITQTHRGGGYFNKYMSNLLSFIMLMLCILIGVNLD